MNNINQKLKSEIFKEVIFYFKWEWILWQEERFLLSESTKFKVEFWVYQINLTIDKLRWWNQNELTFLILSTCSMKIFISNLVISASFIKFIHKKINISKEFLNSKTKKYKMIYIEWNKNCFVWYDDHSKIQKLLCQWEEFN
jgi:hypothetical protein